MENNLNITQKNYISGLFGQAWQDFKNNWKLILLIQLGFGFIGLLLYLVNQPENATTYSSIINIVMNLVTSFFGVGFLVLLLKIVNKETPHVHDLWETITAKKFIFIILTGIVFFLMIVGGYVLFFIPGIILSIGLQFYSYGIADQDKGVWGSLMYSLKITNGYKLKLFAIPLVFLIPVFAAILLSLIPVVGFYLAAAVAVLLVLFLVFVYPLVLARLYNELKTIHEAKVESSVGYGKTLSIVGLVTGCLALILMFMLGIIGVIMGRQHLREMPVNYDPEMMQMIDSSEYMDDSMHMEAMDSEMMISDEELQMMLEELADSAAL